MFTPATTIQETLNTAPYKTPWDAFQGYLDDNYPKARQRKSVLTKAFSTSHDRRFTAKRIRNLTDKPHEMTWQTYVDILWAEHDAIAQSAKSRSSLKDALKKFLTAIPTKKSDNPSVKHAVTLLRVISDAEMSLKDINEELRKKNETHFPKVKNDGRPGGIDFQKCSATQKLRFLFRQHIPNIGAMAHTLIKKQLKLDATDPYHELYEWHRKVNGITSLPKEIDIPDILRSEAIYTTISNAPFNIPQAIFDSARASKAKIVPDDEKQTGPVFDSKLQVVTDSRSTVSAQQPLPRGAQPPTPAMVSALAANSSIMTSTASSLTPPESSQTPPEVNGARTTPGMS